MPRVAAMCGSRRKGSYNQKLLDNAIRRAPADIEIFQVPIREFPFYDQDEDASPPAAVTEAKRLIQTADCVLLVSPELKGVHLSRF